MQRKEILERIRARNEPWDVVVIGGGATGAGCALDAASRGFSVLLLERSDFGKGTSSRSTKLIHGGVRYLEQGNISLVREALSERKLLLDLAPGFIKPQPFVVPCLGLTQKLYYGTGLKIYDSLAGKRTLGQTELLSVSETLQALPGLRSDGLSGGVRYLDAQFDDARFLYGIIETAEELGAATLNYATVAQISPGHPARLSFRNELKGETMEVTARTVINAAGIFADRIESLATGEPLSRISFSQGIHLVFDSEFLPGDSALMIPKTSDGRVLFAIPWLDKLLVGTTDTPVDEPRLEPSAMESEIDFVLKTCGRYLEKPPTRGDIRSVFAGIRPLVRGRREKGTSRISREHLVESPAPGLVSVRGGKWTTYRKMAKDAVDLAIRTGGLAGTRCRTDEVPICEKAGERAVELAVLQPELSEPLVPGSNYTKAEVVDAVRNGKALKIEDVLARRTRLLFLDAQKAIGAVDAVAEIMAGELGWPDDRVGKEISEFKEVASNFLPDGSRDHP